MTPLERKRSVEAAAWSELLTGNPELCRRAGGEVLDVEGTRVLVASGVDTPLFNRAFAARAEPDHLAKLRSAFEARASPRYFLHVDAATCPPTLSEQAAEIGLVRYHRAWVELLGHQSGVASGSPAAGYPGLAATAHGRVIRAPSGASARARPLVREAVTADTEAIAAIFAAGFDLPPLAARMFAGAVGRESWTVFVAAEGDEVMGAGFLFTRGSVGYLAGGATHPRYRQRGVQHALIARRVEHATALGCRWISSETGAAVEGQPQHSYRNLVRAGLEPVGLREHYVPAELNSRTVAAGRRAR